MSFVYKERKFQELSTKKKKEEKNKGKPSETQYTRKGLFEHNVITKYKIQWYTKSKSEASIRI